MLAVFIILLVVLVVSLYSEIHALGLWLLMMIAHNYIAGQIGNSAEHLPLLAGLVIMAAIVARKKWSGIPTNVLVLVVSLFILMTLTAMFGIDPERSLVRVLSYSKGFLLAIIIAGSVKSDAQVQCLTGYCLAAVSIAVCVTFFEHLTGAYIIEGDDIQRAGRFTGNPNDTAQLLLIGIPIALYWATHSNKLRYTIFHFTLVVLIVGAITLTQSRGGFVALLLVLLFIYFKKPSIKASVVALVIFAAGFLFVPPDSSYWQRMQTLIAGQEVESASISKRMHYVKAGVMIILKEPVLGVGMGNFGRAMIAVDPTYNETDENRTAHNMYLEYYVENGVPGGLLFMTFLGIAFLQALRYDKRLNANLSTYGLGFCIAASLLALLVSGLFNSIGKSSVLWFFVGLGFAFQVMVAAARKSAESRHTDILTSS